MIEPGTLLIRKGTILPSSMLLKSSVTNDGFSAVQGGAELLQLKAELAQAGWNYFYMGAVEQTVFGKGPKRIASAMNGVAAKMQLKKCNSLQIDAITPHSVLGHFLLEGIRALLSHPARRNLRRRKAVSTVPGRPWLGTDSQIEWAERIKPLVSGEFDRVAETLEAVARRQSMADRLETRAVIAILEEKRLEVLGRNEAGYFIKNWQELTDQVQRLIRADSRFAAMRLAKAARRKTPATEAEALPDSSAE